MLTTRELLTKMMTFQPVSADVARVNQLVDFLQNYLQHEGVHTAVEILEDRKILYASTAPGREQDLLFNAHLDVVPAGAEKFAATEEDGWLVGRGTHDCLGNCALIANALIKAGPDASAGAIFSTDEEIGGQTTKAMVDRGYSGRHLVLVVDGSGNSIIVAQKGVLVLTLRAHGTACHAAEPWKGENAIDRLFAGYRNLRPLFPTVTPPDEWHNTLAATTMQAGTVHNKVPDVAEMTLNVRFIENTKSEDLIARIRETSGLDVAVEMISPPVACDEEHPVLQGVVDTMRTILERDITVKRSNGATDARHFVTMQVPIAIIGAPGRDLHGDNEALELAGLAAYETLFDAVLDSRRGH